MVTKVLLCRPIFYQIEYEINPWMNVHNKADTKNAQKEHNKLVSIYRKLNLSRDFLEPQLGLPDMTFAANYGFVINTTFIKSNFKFPQRSKEADIAKDYFKKNGFTIKTIPDNIFFEGQGDLLYSGKQFFFGHGKRSHKKAKKYLESYLNADIIDLELIDSYYYHLDTCFAPLNESTVLINPLSFTKEGLKIIKNNFKIVIESLVDDNQVLCCNLVRNDKALIMSDGITSRLVDTLESHGFEVIQTPMNEMIKSGGSVKCLTLEFIESPG